MGQTGDYEWNQAFSSGGWFMLRSAPNYNVRSNASGALLSKMDTTQHNRGWDLSIENGIDQCRAGERDAQGPTAAQDRAGKEARPHVKEVFHYPTPADLTAKDLAQAKTRQETRRQEGRGKAQAGEKAGAAHGRRHDAADCHQVSTSVDPLPVDGHWRHVFFTYDGSGKASGIKIYVNGTPVATRVVADTLGHDNDPHAGAHAAWVALSRCQSRRDTRYQDVRLYGRALTADEVKRLPFEDYVAEMTGKPMQQWNEDRVARGERVLLQQRRQACKAINEPD